VWKEDDVLGTSVFPRRRAKCKQLRTLHKRQDTYFKKPLRNPKHYRLFSYRYFLLLFSDTNNYSETEKCWSLDGSVSIVTDYGLDGRGSFSGRGKDNFLFCTVSRPVMGSTQPPIQRTGASFPKGKAAGAPNLIRKSRMVELYLHSPYASMVWCLINYTQGQLYPYLLQENVYFILELSYVRTVCISFSVKIFGVLELWLGDWIILRERHIRGNAKIVPTFNTWQSKYAGQWKYTSMHSQHRC
jgi:hypothetical protein